jgi:hypothetical protein
MIEASKKMIRVNSQGEGELGGINPNNQNTRKHSTAGSLQETEHKISPISKNWAE